MFFIICFASCFGIDCWLYWVSIVFPFWYPLVSFSQLLRHRVLHRSQNICVPKTAPKLDPLANHFRSKIQFLSALPSRSFPLGVLLGSPWLIVTDVGALLVPFCTLLAPCTLLVPFYEHPGIRVLSVWEWLRRLLIPRRKSENQNIECASLAANISDSKADTQKSKVWVYGIGWSNIPIPRRTPENQIIEYASPADQIEISWKFNTRHSKGRRCSAPQNSARGGYARCAIGYIFIYSYIYIYTRILGPPKAGRTNRLKRLIKGTMFLFLF